MGRPPGRAGSVRAAVGQGPGQEPSGRPAAGRTPHSAESAVKPAVAAPGVRVAPGTGVFRRRFRATPAGPFAKAVAAETIAVPGHEPELSPELDHGAHRETIPHAGPNRIESETGPGSRIRIGDPHGFRVQASLSASLGIARRRRRTVLERLLTPVRPRPRPLARQVLTSTAVAPSSVRVRPDTARPTAPLEDPVAQ